MRGTVLKIKGQKLADYFKKIPGPLISRAVVVNSNMSRGKYLAREGPGSRLGDQPTQQFMVVMGDLPALECS